MTNPRLIIITGTTASGKTGQALRLAKEIGGELISADSRQCYKHLDIITGKDFEESNWQKVETLEERFDLGYYTMGGIPVWLYDVLSPKEYFSAYDWASCAKVVVQIITDHHKIPIIVGGSYFYIKTLLYGLSEGAGAVDWQLRRQLETMTLSRLQGELQKQSPSIYHQLNNSDRNNKRRLIRWIEKAKQVKSKPLSASSNKVWADNFALEFYGRRFAKQEDLIEKIKLRVKERLARGALAEVEILLSMGYSETDPGLRTLGYQELLSHLRGERSLEESVKIWETKERQYAKRQLTFMKKNSQIAWEIL